MRWIQPVDAAQWWAAGFCAVEAFTWRARSASNPQGPGRFVMGGVRDPLAATRGATHHPDRDDPGRDMLT